MKFAVEDILYHLNELKKFNEQNLKNIELTENGEVIKIAPDTLEEWRFIGLTNSFFVEDRYWEKREDGTDEEEFIEEFLEELLENTNNLDDELED